MCVQNALQSSIRSNERLGWSRDAEAGGHWELRVGKLPKIGSLATDQCQHVTMQCIQRQHEIPGAMWRLILLFSLWKTHVVLSIFCQHWQAGPYLARPLLAHAVQGIPSSLSGHQHVIIGALQ